MSENNLEQVCSEIVDKLKKLGADVAIATGEQSTQKQVKFANSKIVRSSVEQSIGIHLFISVGGRTAETLVNPTDKNLQNTLASFVNLATRLPINKDFNGVTKGKQTYGKLNAFDRKTADAGVELVEIVESAFDTAGNTRAGGMLETNTGSTFLVSSEGPSSSEQATSAYFSIRCLAEQNASGHKVAGYNRLDKLNTNELAKQASELAVKAKNPVAATEGTFNVVLDAFPFAALLDPFISSTSIFSIESGLSALGGKLGTQIASPAFSICDNPLAPGAFHSAAFDAEGTATKRVPIVEKGVLKTYLHSTSTAKRHNTTTTGHAGILAPHAFNPQVTPGTASLDELFREAKNGIYITNIWYTRFQNYATGDFSTIPRDAIFEIKNGELARPLRGMRISDNLLGILQRTKLLSSNARQIYGWEVELPIYSCDALVEKVKITTPQV